MVRPVGYYSDISKLGAELVKIIGYLYFLLIFYNLVGNFVLFSLPYLIYSQESKYKYYTQIILVYNVKSLVSTIIFHYLFYKIYSYIELFYSSIENHMFFYMESEIE